MPVGAPCNICEPDPDKYAQIRRINLDGSGMEIVARGVRNTVGFDFHPKTGELWFTDNQRDWLSEDMPNDELNRLTKPGKEHFGYPYCHQGDFLDPEFGWGKTCDDYVKPAALLGPALRSARHALLHGHDVPGRSIRAPSSSPATGRGTAPRSTRPTCGRATSTPTARSARSSRS